MTTMDAARIESKLHNPVLSLQWQQENMVSESQGMEIPMPMDDSTESLLPSAAFHPTDELDPLTKQLKRKRYKT